MIVVIAGPTASGKSALALEIAKRLGSEIVSADSMQIYRGMDVGTAKTMPEERCGIPHHMINIVDPRADFSVAEYAETAEKIIQDIESRQKSVVIVGGTGLYIRALLYPFSFGNSDRNDSLRNTLFDETEKFGNGYVHDKLKSLNAEKASEIHENNVKRVIRAIEIITAGGVANKEYELKPKREFLYFVLNPSRETLYRRIDERVDEMIRKGLQDEVLRLFGSERFSDAQSMQAIGYKEWLPYLDGKVTREVVIATIKQNSRNYAKRQVTWFKRERSAIFLDSEDSVDNLTKIVCDYCEKSNKQEYSKGKNE